MPTPATKFNAVWQRFAIALALSFASAVAHADPVTISGSTSDCTNPGLVGSGPNLPAPSCTTTQDNANNIATYTFSVPFGGFTDFTFGGFSDIDFFPQFDAPDAPPSTMFQPNLSIFLGTGASAVFVVSSYPYLPIQTAASTADLHVFLNAGIYTLAISNRANLALAEFEGGTLGMGFTATGDPALQGNGMFQLTATPIPEPDTVWLAAIGVATLLLRQRQRRRGKAAAVDGA